MKWKFRASVCTLLSVAVIATALSGCGHADRKLAQGVDPKVAKCEPGKQGQKLRLAVSSDVTTLNPFADAMPDTLEINRKVYGTLLDYDFEKQAVEDSGIATTVVAEGDGKTYTAQLRKCMFSDGTPIKADDVVYSYTTAFNGESSLAALLKAGGPDFKAVAKDEQSVSFTFGNGVSPDIAKLILARIPIVSKVNFEANGGSKADPAKIVGSGPFTVESVSTAELVLKANAKYWKVDNAGTALPYVDSVVYQLNVDRKKQSELFAEGKLDVCNFVSPTQLGIVKDTAKVKDAGGSLRVWALIPNTRIDKTKVDPNRAKHFLTGDFRQAFSMMLNRDRLVTAVGGAAKPSYGIIAPGNATWYDPNTPGYSFNLDSAKKKLLETGYKYEGNLVVDQLRQPVRFTLTYPKGPTTDVLAQSIADDLAAGGITVKLAGETTEKWLKYTNSGVFDMALVEVQPDFPDPLFIHRNILGPQLWFSDIQFNPIGDIRKATWYNKITQDFDEVVRKKNNSDRKVTYAAFQKSWNEVCPVFYLISENTTGGVRSNVLNSRIAAFDPAASWNLEELYVK